jgi:NodT family efflux transporter outer membrane factor (OMF) lipoprotein
MSVPSAEGWNSEIEAPKKGLECPEPMLIGESTLFTPWWDVFQDDILSDLETKAIANSPTVMAATSRLEQAYAIYGINRSTLFPEIDLNAQASRQRLSKTAASALAGSETINQTSPLTARSCPEMIGQIPSIPLPVQNCCPTTSDSSTKQSLYANQLALLPTLTYELDFWGKNWQLTQSAHAAFEGQKEELQTVLLMLTAAVADTYLRVRTFDREREILEEAIASRQNNFDLNSSQYEAGLITSLPVEQARSALESSKAALQNTLLLKTLATHALAELIGEPAVAFSVPAREDLPLLPEIPYGVPSDVLKQRPDIRQQQHLLEAAIYNVGVAKTEYFPDFTIALNYGFLSSHTNNLFKWKSHTWLAAADAALPLFTAGRIESSINEKVALYKQQVASYIQTILTAFKEVEDAVFSLDYQRKQFEFLEAQVVASQEVYTVANVRYRMGVENYLLVVDSERTLLESRRLAVQVLRERYSSVIALIKSLGGIWPAETSTVALSD